MPARRVLESAAAYCAKLTRRSQSSFYYAFLFLPPERREALEAVYAFCRLVDDAADDARSPDEARARLAAWRRAVEVVFADGEPAPGAAIDGVPDEVVAQLRRGVRAFAI